MARKRLLFLTTQLPFPAQSGGVIKTFRMLEYFAERFEVTLLCLLKGEDQEHVGELQERLPGIVIHAVPCERRRSVKALINSYIQGKTLNLYRNFSEDAAQMAEELADEHQILFVDHYEMFQYVPLDFPGDVVLHEHNAEYMLWERYAELEPNWVKKSLLRNESLRVRKAERRYALEADLILAAPEDGERLLDIGVDRNKLRKTYHLGEDELLKLPALKFTGSKELLFIGTLSWESNVNGLLFFLRKIFPHILQEEPQTVFHMVGKNPDKRLIKAAKKFGESVQIPGFVEDVEPYFQRCAAFVLPLRFGSGMKVKFLNAMYRGLPVVSTTIGAESISVKDEVHALIADEAKDFAQECLLVMKEEKLWNTLSSNSRELADQKYRWEPHLKQLGSWLGA